MSTVKATSRCLGGLTVVILAGLGLNTTALAGTSVASAAALTAAATTSCTGVLAGLDLVAGSGQVTKVAEPFGTALEVKAVDTGGCPMDGQYVDFTLPTSGPTAYFPGGASVVTVTTGSDGTASAPALTANSVSGSYTAEATAGTNTVFFDLTNSTAGAPSSVSISEGDNQSVPTAGTFQPLQVVVRDNFGDAVAGVSVNFTVTSANGAGASFSGGGTSVTVQTDQSGLAETPSLTAGTTVGAFTVVASVTGAASSATFNLDVSAGAPSVVTAGVGTSQSAQLGTDFAVPLAVTVTDTNGNAVAGATVTFAAPAQGASGVFAGTGTTALVTTNSDGVATAPDFSANQRTGGYVVTATVPGVTQPATFALVNEPRPTASAPGLKGSYWLATSAGRVLTSGGAKTYGSVPARRLSGHISAMAVLPGGGGYWMVSKKGTVYGFGSAKVYAASSSSRPGRSPIVAMAATSDGKGYWLVAANGTVYSYGDAVSYGPLSPLHPAKPIVAMAATSDGKGYWLVAADGGVFNYGDAHFYGALSRAHIASPVVGIAALPAGDGYFLATSKGAVYAFGHAAVFGSGTALSPKPVVGIVPTSDGDGYWLVSSNGTMAGFGDAGAQGNGQAKGVVAGAA